MNSRGRRKQKRAAAKRTKDALIKELQTKGLTPVQIAEAVKASQ